MKSMLWRALLAVLLCSLASALPAVEIEEWTVPWPDTRPRDPSVGADGRIWFVGQVGNYLAVFDPATARFERFELPKGTAPHTVVVAPDGSPWVAGNGNGTLLRYDTQGRLQQSHRVPTTITAAPDPHTIAMDGHGGFWFSMQNGNAIGHFEFASGRIRVVAVPTAQARPYGIVATAAGDAWAVLFGVGKLARIERKDMTLTEVDLPRPLSRPRRIALDRNGAVWYVDYAQGFLGRHDPVSGNSEEWPAPSKSSGPYAMTATGTAICFFETSPQPNLLQCFDPTRARFEPATPVPGGARSVRHMEFDRKRGRAWFGTDANTLGVVRWKP
jgi:virginiamycin B lyase